ncbi:hypothetical protein AnigIFM63604_006138 [Aspergillus niger]|uniref:Zn(2)-C6 fungal-type domain-containing protein n=1 Tax=Aspergillus niger TaxID=5061 RepID=A0A9W6AE03_ASPNG|nr:hypothetical protein AnigIFM63604_006138 [Aspergillus niger]
MTAKLVQQTEASTGLASFPRGTSERTGWVHPSRPDYNDATTRSHRPALEAHKPVFPPSELNQSCGQDQLPLPYCPVYGEQPRVPPATQHTLPDPWSEPASEAHPSLIVALPGISRGVKPPNVLPLAMPHTAPAAYPSHPAYPPMNGTSHEPSTHSAPPEYRGCIPLSSQEAQSNSDAPLRPNQYLTPVPLHLSHTPAPYDSGNYNNPVLRIHQQRKAPRAQQACDQCRLRKAKCDEGRPACTHCEENNMICVYKEVPPHKQEKAAQPVLDRMQQLEDCLVEKLSHLQHLQSDNVLQLRQLINNAYIRERNFLVPEQLPKQTRHQIFREDPAEAFQDTKLPRDENGAVISEQSADDVLNNNQALITGEDGELSIPVEHTTAAHKLLSWPSIKTVLEPKVYDDDYVLRLEEQRGPICIYGRGEGDETSEDPVVTSPSTNPSTALEEAYIHSPSPSGPWGAINQSPSKLADIGLDDAGRVTTTPSTIRRYHESYMNHLHKLHPFVDQNDLEQKIQRFITTYCSGAGMELPRGAKRKRSCDAPQGTGCDIGDLAAVKAEEGPNIVEKSINNAIVLLVLALGCICEVQDRPVPGPIANHAGRMSTAGRPYPDDPNLRNLDVIPGLAFYAYATSILGNLQGANDLQHVQAALLAGLYAGQLAHPFQSHGWIAQAARTCQVLVRPERYGKMRDGPVKELYNFAYWTCFQLESDILAELDLPPSGISRSEARIALPNGRYTLSLPDDISAPSTMMMFFYSAQIHLRRCLNRIHTDLYKVDRPGQTHWSSSVQETLSMNLELWRSCLPETLKWKDSDPPSKDINVARMRAKYYGARYIIHRPLLYYALHYASQPNVNADAHASAGVSSVDNPAAPAASTVVPGPESQPVAPSMTHSQGATGMAHLSSDAAPSRNALPPDSTPGQSQRTYRELPMKLRRACKVCIESAIKSTEAFDGIEGRPILTNIFGTAHAQFGNMLVISATYKSNLSELVDRNDLERLLKRTIQFLLERRYISPSLRADARILTEIYERIFGEHAGSFTTCYD